MTTFTRIAWRNLAKRPKRTAILVLAIGIGLFGVILFQVLLDGFMVMMVDTVVDTTMGHIQIHHPEYRLEQESSLVVANNELVRKTLTRHGIKAFSPRVVSRCLVSSARAAVASQFYGVDSKLESQVTDINERIVEGKLPGRGDKRGVCIGRALARKLKVNLGDKIVIMARDLEGEMGGAALRVCGLFKAHSEGVEKAVVYMSEECSRDILALAPGKYHEYAIRLDKAKELDKIANELRSAFAAAEQTSSLPQADSSLEASSSQKADSSKKSKWAVETWAELEPVIKQQIDLSWVSTTIMFGVVFIALSFGILNAFMMEIFERIHEFGVMMSLGTRPFAVFRTLIYEGLFVGLLGGVVGTTFAIFFNEVVLQNELDLTRWASGMKHFNFASKVPMYLTPTTVLMCVSATITVCLVATLYPALRAAWFRPVEALRHY